MDRSDDAVAGRVMAGRREDIPHFTDAEVDATIARAVEMACDPDVPDELRVAVFQKAADMLSAKQIMLEQIQPAGLLGINRG